jgi:diguanylate cyclase (GGDEF)-like protein/PAS domain S-box-containing protein/hemerythrin-like metal-binding protein
MPFGIVVRNTEGRITQCNPAAERILGLSVDQLIGATSIDPRWHAVDESGATFSGEHHPAMRALATGEPVTDVVMGVFNPQLEAQVWLNVSATPIKEDASGKVVAVYAIFQDITDRRRTQAELAEKRAQYQIAIETSTDGFLVVDTTGRISEANQAYATLSGYTRDELLHMSIPELEARENPDQTQQHIRTALGQGYELFESQHRAKDGRIWPVEVAMTYSEAGGGRFFAFLRDISRRKEYDAQNMRFEALVESSQDAIIGKTLDGIVTSWNAGAQSLFGYSPQEMVGQPIQILLPKDRHQEEDDILAGIRRGESVSHIETLRVRKDGSLVDVSVSISPIRNSEGAIVGASKIARDISGPKRNERIQAARERLMKFAGDHSLHDLLVATLDEVCLLTGSAIGFYHFLDSDQKTLSLQAWSTRTTQEYCTAAGAGAHYNIDEAGVWVDCIRQRAATIHNDYATLPNKRGLPPGHAALVREMVIPVFRNNLIVAILGVGNKNVFYSDLDVQAASQLADMVWDLIETKRAELSLRESEERFQRVMEATHDGIWDWNTEDDSGYFSPSYFRLLGYEPGAFPMNASGWTQLIHPDDVSRVLQVNQECIENRIENFEVEYRMRAKDGSWKWILGRGKAFRRNAMGRALRMVGTHIDITERKEAEIQINFLAYHDQLTGLPNRTLFFDRFSQAITFARRTEKKLALLFLDLDGFKPVNDRYGHDAGDIVLKAVAERLQAAIRGIDTVARLGGDEFAMILGQLDSPQEAGLVAAKLVAVVGQPVALDNGELATVTASIGIAMHPANGSEMDLLLGKADAAMYQSKERGGNRFTFWDGASQEHRDADHWIELGAEQLVGFEPIDAQHRHLADLCNQLHQSIRAGMASNAVAAQLCELLEYVKFHFLSESRWMEQTRYPGKKSHDRAHARLLVDASHFENLLHRGGDLFVLRSISDWLVDHIQSEDMALGAFLRQLQDGVDPPPQ